MGKIYSNSFGASFGSYSFYNSNKNLNEFLRKKKTKKQLYENGFKVVNTTIKKAYTQIESTHDVWIFPPEIFKGYITQSGFKDKGQIYSHYGRVLSKWKCQDGNIYLYSTRIPVLDDYRKVYVFTNKERKVIKELWIV